MPVIKRYPNRKLYDTEAKQYITLDGVAMLIREGKDVTVVDHATGEDLTALTLTQVISEQEKKRSGFLPQSVLAGLIQAGGDTMDALRRTLANPLNLARQVDEEIERRVGALVSRGVVAAEEGRQLRDDLLGSSPAEPDAPWPDDEDLERLLARRNVPTRQDLQQLLEQLDDLVVKLDEATREPE